MPAYPRPSHHARSISIQYLDTTGFEETAVEDLLPDNYEAILDSYVARRQASVTSKTKSTGSREGQS